MVRFLRLSALILVLSTGCISAGAQVLHHLDTIRTTLYFHKNSFVLESDYRNNGEKLRAFTDSVSAVMENGELKLVSLSGTVGSSLNGIAFDERFLCEKRISTLNYLLSKEISIQSGRIHLTNIGQNWKRLEACVEADPKLSNKDDVLHIVGRTPVKIFIGDTLSRNRVEALMKLERGKVWKELEPDIFPEMDVAEIYCIYQYPEILAAGIPHSTQDFSSQIPDNSGKKEYLTEKDIPKNRFHMSIRTNLLYDLALVPNIGVDVAIGKHFSISATWEYAYWTLDSKNIIHKVYGGDASFRWWFGRKGERQPLTGHHLGPYGQMAAFDFAYGEQRWSATPWQWAVGLEYGYTLPFKKGRMALDFTIGAGYANVCYSHWHITSNGAGEKYYEWDQRHECRYIGPTKAEVSLIWLIGGKHKQQIKYR